MVLVALGLLLASCATPAPVVRPVQPPELAPWTPLVEWYEQHPGPEAAPPRAVVAPVVQGCIELEHLRGVCLQDLDDARRLGGVDDAVSAGQLAGARDERDRLGAQRKWYAVGGAVLLAVLEVVIWGIAQ
jgi:hypothetical protein